MSRELVQAYLNKFPERGETGHILLYIMFVCRQLNISFQIGLDTATGISRGEQKTSAHEEPQGYQMRIDDIYQIDGATGKEVFYSDLAQLAAAGLQLLRVAMEKRLEEPGKNGLDRNLIISDN